MLFLWLCVALASCVQREEDPLVKMSEDVEKKDRGIDIQITPVDKK